MTRLSRGQYLVDIHREIGLAGYVTSAEFDPDLRRDCLARATEHLTDTEPYPTELAAVAEAAAITEYAAVDSLGVAGSLVQMFSDAISASDALAGELGSHEVSDELRDRLQLVHAHVMSACELLDERLTVMELAGVGIDGFS